VWQTQKMIKNHALQHQKTSGSNTGLMSEYSHQDHDEECSTDDWYQHDQQSGGGTNQMKSQTGNLPLENREITTGTGDNNNDMNLLYSREEDLEDYSNEPPLLEELGIRFDHIFTKTQAVMIPTKVEFLPRGVSIVFILPASFLDDR
jgi:hypothetical protein